MDLSIIIVNWNTKDYLEQCLKSVFEQTKGIDYEVFVVDNASSDGSQDMVKEKFPQVKLIENKENVGFAKANNQAIRLSNSKYILLLNSDTKVLDNSITKMISFMESHPEVGASGCKLLNSDLTFQQSVAKFPSFWQTVYSLTLLGIFLNKTFSFFLTKPSEFKRNPFEVECIAGAFFLVRNEVIQKVGLLDETFFIFSEDIDWCFRIIKNNWKIYYIPQCQIVHHWGQSTKAVPSSMFIELYKAKFQFWKKHYSQKFLHIIKSILLIDCAIKLFIWSLLFLFNPKKIIKKIKLNYKLIKYIKNFN